MSKHIHHICSIRNWLPNGCWKEQKQTALTVYSTCSAFKCLIAIIVVIVITWQKNRKCSIITTNFWLAFSRYCHSDVRPSVHPSVVHIFNCLSQLKFLELLFYIALWQSPVRAICDFRPKCQPSWIQNGRHPNRPKNTFYLVFSSLSVIFTWIAYHLILEVKG